MNRIVIDDDDELEVEEQDSDVTDLKSAVIQGMEDLKAIVGLLNDLSSLMEPFGDSDTIDELRVLYSEIIPNILVGDYDEVLEGLDDDQIALTKLALSQRRKHIVSNLLEKYNN